MRRFAKLSLTLALVALMASPAPAQRQRPQQGGRGGGTLLTNKSVQEELKLDKDQVTKVGEMAKTLTEKRQEIEKKEGVTRENRREKMPVIQKAMAEVSNKLAADILTKDQMVRFKQI